MYNQVNDSNDFSQEDVFVDVDLFVHCVEQWEEEFDGDE